MAQSKKYSITLDRSVYESDDLNQLEQLAKAYSIKEGYDDIMYPIDFMHNMYEPENIIWLIYNNELHIDVRKDLLTKKELKEFRKLY